MLKLLTVLVIGLLASTIAEESKDAVRKTALENINKYLNPSVNPCDNFFQYACGNWDKYNKIPQGDDVLNGHKLLSKSITDELKNSLEQDTAIINADVEVKVKEFYKSCLNKDIIKEKGSQPLVKFFTDINSLPPVLNKEWDESKFNWQQIESKLQSYGFDSLLGIKVLTEGEHKDKLFVGEITLPLLPSTYEDSSKKAQLDEYSEYVFKTLTETFAVDAATAKSVAAEIVQFETQLAKGVATENLVLGKDKTYVPSTVDALIKLYPAIEWEKFLTDMYETPIDKSFEIIELKKPAPEYLPNLFEVIQKTPKSTIANYQFWSAIRQFLNAASAANAEAVTNCIAKTKELYPVEIAYIYSQKHYDNELKADLETMLTDIKNIFHTALEKAEWFDEETKKQSLKRLDGIKLSIIGFPKDKKYTPNEELTKLPINADEYYRNYLELQHYIHKNFHQRLFKKTENEFNVDPSSIQLYYDIKENAVKISLGFLNPPFYNKDLPRNMKFAQLGAILMHEISHSVDRLGQNTDLNGKNVFWWNEKSSNEFYDKAQCFEKLYEKYGAKDISENLADNIGIKYSYLAYKNWADSIKDTKKDVFDLEQFPGLDFTYKQLFFITHAQTWCHYAQNNGKTVYPVEFRINTPMTNFNEFATEFKCPEDSFMNPKNKCVLW